MAVATNTKMNLTLDMRIVVALLLVIIVGMLAIWKPWSASGTDGRTVETSGEVTLKAEPDEYVFYPNYQFKHTDKTAALSELTAKSNEVTSGLKKAGVDSSDIKTDSSGYDFPVYVENSKEATYSLQFTVTVDSQDMAQKVQDYLLGTAPTGSVSPTATFSDAKRKSLESRARDEATKDARGKADQMAKNLGFKIGKVKSVSDGSGFDAIPFRGGNVTMAAEDTDKASLPVQPGQNELNYSVTVTYFIR